MSDILERVKAMPGALTTVAIVPPPPRLHWQLAPVPCATALSWQVLCLLARCQLRTCARAAARHRAWAGPREGAAAPSCARDVCVTVRVPVSQVEDAKSVLTKFRMTGANRVRDRLRTDEGEGEDSVCPQLPRARTLMCTKAMSRASRSSVLLNEPTCKYHLL